jgi:hypothetical protein
MRQTYQLSTCDYCLGLPLTLMTLAPMTAHPFFLIPGGTWAEWVGAVVAVAVLAFGSHQWKIDRRTAAKLELSRQARNVDAWIGWVQGASQPTLGLSLVNASSLPIRHVLGKAYGYPTPAFEGKPITEITFDEIVIVVPGAVQDPITTKEVPEHCYQLEWFFTDSQGVRWKKVDGSEVVRA